MEPMESSSAHPRRDPDFLRIYDELRALARRRLREGLGGASLQATALVHEVWVKLSSQSSPATREDSHFWATAAQAMRWILVDRARRRRTRAELSGAGDSGALELAGAAGGAALDPAGLGADRQDQQVLALDLALERLERSHPRMAAVVLHRHFAGLSVEETAAALGISTATVKREWRFARAWLLRELTRNRDC